MSEGVPELPSELVSHVLEWLDELYATARATRNTHWVGMRRLMLARFAEELGARYLYAYDSPPSPPPALPYDPAPPPGPQTPDLPYGLVDGRSLFSIFTVHFTAPRVKAGARQAPRYGASRRHAKHRVCAVYG